ncbi:general substrate transporter [Pestalotiopsis sp. NC0098]|nr:general substrate transporter [Pestalotiopsis sp. NC0098]
MSCKDDTTGAIRSDHVEDAIAMDAAVQRALAEDDIDRELGIPAILRKYWRVSLTCSVSFTAGLVFGYDVTVNGASISMPSFLLYFGDINASGPYLPSLWTSLWTAMSSLMQAIGAIIAGWISVRLGRKWPACAGACLTLVGTALQYIAVARGTLLAGKMVSGLGIGCVYSIATTYAGEIAPLRLRAPIQTCLVAFIILTQAVALGVIRAFVPIIDQSAFRFVFALQWAVGGLAVVSWACAPESPVYLVTRGKTEAARNAMRRIYGNSDHTDDRLACLIHDIKLEEASQQDKGTYAACFRGSHLRRTMTIALLFSLTNVSGAAFLSQNIYFLITAGLEAIHAFDIGIGGFGLALLIIAVNSAYMHRCNRRSLILVGLTINFVFMITIGALYWAPGEGALWAIAVLMNVLISLTTSTLQAAAWPVAAEIPSYHLRAKSISLGVFTQTITSWLFIFVTPYMYNVDTGDLGGRTGFIYAGTTLLLGICAFRLVPDTTGLTTTEVDAAYAAGVSPRRFQEFTSEAARDEDSKA